MRTIVIIGTVVVASVGLAGCKTPPSPVSTPCGVLDSKRYSLIGVQGKTRPDIVKIGRVVAVANSAGCWQ